MESRTRSVGYKQHTDDLQSLPNRIYESVDWVELQAQIARRGADVSLFSDILKKADAALAQAFHEGEDIMALVKGRARIIDFILRNAWQSTALQNHDNLALIAVGGYGRNELHPYSDVDLLFLIGDTPDEHIQDELSVLIAFLWDIGLPVGHSTRSVKDCVIQVQQDITVATNLLEARLIAGSQTLFQTLHELAGVSRLWSSRDFFKAKLEEKKNRYAKFGDTGYRLEPNVKEGPGGLRDYQMIGWIAKHHWKAKRMHELVEHRCLTEREYRQLLNGRSHLWRVRFALHLLTGKSEDRLLFDQQLALAKLFGYEDKQSNLAVEQFMQTYYRTIGEMERLNEMLLQLFEEIILFGEEPTHFEELEPRFHDRFQSRNGFLEVCDEEVFQNHPSALFEIFLALQRHPELKGVRACTIRLIRDHRYLIDERFRNNRDNRALFMEILRQPTGITRELRRMHRYGVLSAYWSSFAKIVGRMQYDLFHAYTVDEHTLLVLSNVRRYTKADLAHELPFCTQLMKEIPKPEILYIAALFHDIAKGRGGDHSELGADEAAVFCLQHGMNLFDASLVAWLVRNHLLMSLTAQRMDIGDPTVVNDFASKMGSILRLKHLYLLTVADIRGTNESLWNAWRDALLLELYHAAHRVLRRGRHLPIIRGEVITETKRTALQILKDAEIPRSKCERLWWDEFDDDYFLRHSADEVAWHTQCLIETGRLSGPRVLVRRLTTRGCTEIFVYTRDHKHLFAHIATVLDQQALNIVDARIYTTRAGYALDTFLVLDELGSPVTEQYRIDDITENLSDMLKHPQQAPSDVVRRMSRHMKLFNIETKITFDNEPDSRSTQLELITADHPGLLSKVGKAFIDSNVLVDSARITTIGAQAEDMFYITNMNHHPILSTERQEFIRQNILKRLQELPGSAGRSGGQ